MWLRKEIFFGWDEPDKIIGQTCRNAEMVAIIFQPGFFRIMGFSLCYFIFVCVLLMRTMKIMINFHLEKIRSHAYVTSRFS